MYRLRLCVPALLLILCLLLSACGSGSIRVHLANGQTRSMNADSTSSLLHALDREFSGASDQIGYAYRLFADQSCTVPVNPTDALPTELWQALAPVRVRLTLDARGGALDTTEAEADYDAAYPALPVPEKEGFLFSGWFTQEVGGQRADGQVCKIAEDHTLYAFWIPQTYYAVYLYQGQDSSSPVTLAFPVEGSAALPACPFTLEGSTFVGWSTAPDGTGDFYADQTELDSLAQAGEVVRLYAIWNEDETSAVAIRFEANGGEGGMDSILRMTVEGVDLPENGFVREGFTFAGWSLAEDGEAEYEPGESFLPEEGENVLYAVWEEVESTPQSTPAATPKPTATPRPTSTPNPTTAPRPTATPEPTSSPSDSTEYGYSVVYSANGGSGSMANSQHVNGTPSKLTSNAFTNPGYTFAGWTTQADGTGLYFADGETVSDLAIRDGDVIYLFALWQ